MNDFTDLEAELKQLRPVAPSAEMMGRVAASLDQRRAATATGGVLPRRSRVNWLSLGLGFAAATAVFVLLARPKIDQRSQSQPRIAIAPQATAPAVARSFVPDGLTSVVYARSDEGLIFPGSAAAPVRRVRSRSRETLQWKNPDTGASLRVSYPAEEVELIPVPGQ